MENIQIILTQTPETVLPVTDARFELSYESLRLQTTFAEAIVQAQEQERIKIGHELHDNVNQLLTTAKLFIEMLKPVAANDIMVVNRAKEALMAALTEIRNISQQMVIPQLKNESLQHSMQMLLDDTEASGRFNIEFESGPFADSDIGEGKKITLYRILQEQIKNIIKHSKARRIKVLLKTEDKNIRLCIEDDGIGFDTSQKRNGIGLTNIYDRIRLYQGSVNLITAPGEGCLLTIQIPIG
jgi:signal transduction histidine kinase